MIKKLQRLAKNTSGVALIEFGLAMPIFVLLLIGAIEIARFTYFHQKMDKAAYAVTDLVTRDTALSLSDLEDMSSAAEAVLKPTNIDPVTNRIKPFDGAMVFTSVSSYAVNDINKPAGCTAPANYPSPTLMCINWQYQLPNTTLQYQSMLGGVTNPTLPGGYIVTQGQDIIIIEMYFKYEPIMNLSRGVIAGYASEVNNLTPDGLVLYKTSIYKPRQGRLVVPPV